VWAVATLFVTHLLHASVTSHVIPCHPAGSLVRQFRLRQKFSLADNLEAAAGLAYDFKSERVSPTGSLIYRLDADNKKSRIELSTLDKKLLVRKGWQVRLGRRPLASVIYALSLGMIGLHEAYARAGRCAAMAADVLGTVGTVLGGWKASTQCVGGRDMAPRIVAI
jgi:hypothetical protein